MMNSVTNTYDAVLLISFGGPERPEDVMPFLENVLRGRNVPRARMLEVAEHYHHFGGRSPINEQNRVLRAALQSELDRRGPQLPVYWGNRNWHPLLPDTLRQMAEDGVSMALAFVTSAFSSYSSCRQYLEDIERAREKVGPTAPKVHKLRAFYNHPGFVETMVERVGEALNQIPVERRPAARLVYTAHSIPVSMAQTSPYEEQLQEACRLVSAALGRPDYRLVFQSRSGPSHQPWLEPDIGEYLRRLAGGDRSDVVIVPIGFVSDHLEVAYDLDVEARRLCDDLGLSMVRAATVGVHPRFVEMIRELIVDRIDALDSDGSFQNTCPVGCCLPPPDYRHVGSNTEERHDIRCRTVPL